ncbi:MAG: hypothetical protein WCL32_05295 [Planctomycetota bacterium]
MNRCQDGSPCGSRTFKDHHLMTRTLGSGLLFAAMAILLGTAPGQDVPGGVLHTRAKQFRVPFNVGPNSQNLSQLQLYVSTDAGRSWQSAASAPPEQGYFRFSSEREGSFWFAVQSFDKMNRAFPPNMEGATPNLKVVVDTQAPQVTVQPLNSKTSEVGVSWMIRDENFNANQADAIRLDYRSLNAGATWIPLSLASNATQFFWNPNTNGPVEVRVQARDQAGNVGEAFTRVSLDNAPGTNFAPTPGSGNPGYTRNYDPSPTSILNAPAPSDIKLVGSKRIALGYDLKDVGPSRVAAIDLWYTHDGRSWTKYGQPFADEAGKNLIFEVEREGLYGITLNAKSGVGLGERPPQSGDRPQVWIEVDLTKPVVSMRNVLVGQGIDKGKLKIAWTASDKNLGPSCISLKYAEAAAGPWTAIAEKLGNVGEHTWTMPAAVPYQFYIKVEAVDRAGNLGEDATPQPVKVDLSIPRAVPLSVGPAN